LRFLPNPVGLKYDVIDKIRDYIALKLRLH